MFVDNLLLWLHIAAAIFCVGPVTVATSFTPRYIRQGELSVVRFLLRTTRIFGILTLLVFVTGLALGRDRLAEPWLTVSMTLFIVAFALLFAMVQRDQAKAVKALAAAEIPATAPDPIEPSTDPSTEPSTEPATTEVTAADTADTRKAVATDSGTQPARIGAFSGVIALLWLVILVFMVWQPGS